MGGVDRERGEHREDLLVEDPVQMAAVLVIEGRVGAEPHPRLGEQRADRGERARLLLIELERPRSDPAQLLGGGEAVGREGAYPRGALGVQVGDAHLEELVEVGAEDGHELGALERPLPGVVGLHEHPGVELEPAEMPVEEPGGLVRGRPRGAVGGRAGGGAHGQPSSSTLPVCR